MNKSDFIAVFDSGVGGISVLRHLRNTLPQERFLYYGDSANAPYGSRPIQEVQALTLSAVEKVLGMAPVKALVVACNTATAASIEVLREAYPDLIIVGIEPAVKVAADHFPGGRVGVMATEVTLREKKFDILLHRFQEECTIVKIPAPGLVPLIEQGKVDAPETLALLHRLLDPYRGKLDALVLGCTHFPFAGRAISQILGDEVALLEGGGGTARETQRRLAEADLLYDGPGELKIHNSSPDKGMIQLSYERLNQGR